VHCCSPPRAAAVPDSVAAVLAILVAVVVSAVDTIGLVLW
jgi:hypothetical protein